MKSPVTMQPQLLRILQWSENDEVASHDATATVADSAVVSDVAEQDLKANPAPVA